MKAIFLKLNIWRILIAFVLLLLLLFFIIHRTITPVFFNLAEVEVQNIVNEVINQAVNREVEKLLYQDIVSYIYNEQGEIVLIQPNIGYINKFTTQLSLAIQKELQGISRETVSVPISRILGIDLLAAYGPELKMRIIPAGYTVPPRLVDSFSSAGINQTRHKIYLTLSARVKLIVPFKSRSIDVQADVPVTEVVILGRVPQVYVGMNQESLGGILYRGENNSPAK
ncbi:MAG TPA: sporulation protein YunB [Halanaerobiaceae bacterium]|jgi:sporulation protein YunB|nr:sporulation protein YunB [Bacillota bacterium]HHU92825.1 sporulation protein YunB [Halanaerobiaceae bacterium]HOA40692.1 sporulation protein YunB [Halanaerobiales bacterium]HPZ63044.1 sporulation protein YunB [Halanaerobiales bacterium]HQD04522.1 sporulation protein YunB [Halanaerobiales bacterium]